MVKIISCGIYSFFKVVAHEPQNSNYTNFVFCRQWNCMVFMVNFDPRLSFLRFSPQKFTLASNNMSEDISSVDTLVFSGCSYRTPLHNCECGGELKDNHNVNCQVYDLTGIHKCNHITVRCSSKKCRSTYGYNYRVYHGSTKLNTLRLDLSSQASGFGCGFTTRTRK